MLPKVCKYTKENRKKFASPSIMIDEYECSRVYKYIDIPMTKTMKISYIKACSLQYCAVLSTVDTQ